MTRLAGPSAHGRDARLAFWSVGMGVPPAKLHENKHPLPNGRGSDQSRDR